MVGTEFPFIYSLLVRSQILLIYVIADTVLGTEKLMNKKLKVSDDLNKKES